MAACIASSLVRVGGYALTIAGGAELANRGADDSRRAPDWYLFGIAIISAVAETALAYFVGLPLTLFATAGIVAGCLLGNWNKQPHMAAGLGIMGLALSILHPAVPLVPIVVSAL